MTNNKIERRLIGSPLGAFEASTLENLAILIPIDDVSEEANHSHDDNDDNGCLNCQYHKR
ncbi:MAG: hypothetical protein DMG17_01175 [Acidobacteria bacterium]|nr:MAG: hypothetical protein DMG17_01175 [Acidobacteriota bacterium]